jgi:ABC-type multidrug transport system fused ATPase/permease subunit
MSEAAVKKAALKKESSLFKEVLGKNQFDDRIDTETDINTGQALAVIGRSIKLITQARGLFCVKFLLQLGLVFPALLLPWMAKILTDNVVLQRPFNDTEVIYPPFMDPILAMMEGKDPLEMMLVLTSIYVVLLVTFGFRGGKAGAGLLQGKDAATQAENMLSAGGSGGSGLWGITEFMVDVRMHQSIANRLRTRLFDRLSRMPMTALDDQRIGDSVFRVLYDAPHAPDLAFRVTLIPFFMGLSALINLYILQYSYGKVAPELVWIAWATVPVMFLFSFPFSGSLRRTNQNKRAAGSATTNAMEESMSNVGAVQSLGATKQEQKRFDERSGQTFLRERYALAVMIVAGLFMGSASALAGLYVTILTTNQIIDGAMSPGDYAALIGIFYGIAVPAGYFGGMWLKLQETIAAVRRVFFFLDYESEEDRVGGTQLQRIEKGVRLEGVSFDYPDGSRALSNVDLELPMGELVALVGPTGAGKTTLAYLIPSLVLPTSGRVLIDDADIMGIDIDSLRRQVTYVFQEHVLLSESIRENLMLANSDASEADMTKALETAGCMEFINKLPGGIDTVLGRGGDTLSVGQQQRLSIARGLIRDSQVLILDEPTAALDPATENQLVASLRSAAADRLVVVIAHRLSTIRKADRIVFLEDGEIKDIGSHDELMAKPDSPYREFVDLQNA